MIEPEEVIAIDWSGALDVSAQRRGICAAVCEVGGDSVELIQGRVRTEVEASLLAMAARGAAVVAGLDFSFSYPAWFLRELGCGSAPELWALAAERGEAWLGEPQPPFWGRKGRKQPASHRGPERLGYRQCELATAASGHLPSSSFQVGGAGAVGTGTLRGMPMLLRLREAGWSVWPFDSPRLPMFVEIYPRVLTGPVVKSSAGARAGYLSAARFGALAPIVREQAAASEDAFDALVSALAMREYATSFGKLQQAEEDEGMRLEGTIMRLEGTIWVPASSC